ncbi:MAG: FAD-binding protein, partial [Actinomycetota bacterium]
MSGTLLLPTSSGYAGAAQDYNTVFDSHRPAAVAQCTIPGDVQACLEVAAAAKLPVAARSGGHSYAGYSNPTGGLII